MRRLSAAAMLLGLILTIIALPVAATESKYFVCKYVGTPGVNESLQTGDNPISIGGGSLPDPVVVGTFFNDSQGRSYILAEDVGQPEPDPSTCPPPDTGGTPALFSVPCDPEVTGEPSRIQIIATVLLDLHLFLDDTEVIFDGEGFAEVAPGTYDWEIRNDDGDVLASGTIEVVTCDEPPPPPTGVLFSVVPCTQEGGPSQVQIEAAVLEGLRLFLNGTEEFFDGDGRLTVSPGTYDFVITEADGTTVLLEGTVEVADCTIVVNPPPPPPPGPTSTPTPGTPGTPGGPTLIPNTAMSLPQSVGLYGGIAVMLLGALLMFNARARARRK